MGVGVGVLKKTRVKASDEMNELDVVAVWNNRLLIVECKAGRQLFNGKDQEILHKLDQLKDNAGGALGMGWLVTTRALNEHEASHADVLQRAELNRITVRAGAGQMKRLGTALAKALAKALGCREREPWPPAAMALLAGLNANSPKRQ